MVKKHSFNRMQESLEYFFKKKSGAGALCPTGIVLNWDSLKFNDALHSRDVTLISHHSRDDTTSVMISHLHTLKQSAT